MVTITNNRGKVGPPGVGALKISGLRLPGNSSTEVAESVYDGFKDSAMWRQWCSLGYVTVADPREHRPGA